MDGSKILKIISTLIGFSIFVLVGGFAFVNLAAFLSPHLMNKLGFLLSIRTTIVLLITCFTSLIGVSLLIPRVRIKLYRKYRLKRSVVLTFIPILMSIAVIAAYISFLFVGIDYTEAQAQIQSNNLTAR